jgi:predicted glycosyltransferase
MSHKVAPPSWGDASTPDTRLRSERRRLRIVLYGQSLSGTGHFVRTYELAQALAARHDVHLIDGGWPVPRPQPAHPFAVLSVPRIRRLAREIVPVDPGQRIDAVLVERRRAYAAALEQIRPDAVVIEHFPFSKWGLREEILSLIEHARAVRPGVRVFASVRDIPPGTGDDPRAAPYKDYVLRMLSEYFDGLLVHTDPALVGLEEHIPWTAGIAVPIACTGYVSEKLHGRPARGHGQVIVSTGGAELPTLVARTLDAWRQLRAGGATGDRRLVVFRPPFERSGQGVPASEDPSVCFVPFTTEFLPWMAGADLSISQAGYNTCTNVLETRIPAILVASAAMSDQYPRARRFAERGLACALPSAELTAERLASAMLDAFARGRVAHHIDLQGARTTCALIEEWCTEQPARAQTVREAYAP